MRVELLYWAGCPSVEAAISMLETELAHRGQNSALLQMQQIVTLDDARRERFTGSPTIRINARDVVEASGDPALGCRIYRLRDGRISALPDPQDVRDAFDAVLPSIVNADVPP